MAVQLVSKGQCSDQAVVQTYACMHTNIARNHCIQFFIDCFACDWMRSPLLLSSVHTWKAGLGISFSNALRALICMLAVMEVESRDE